MYIIAKITQKKSQKFLYKFFYYYVLYNCIFSLYQCLLPLSMVLLHAPCPMQCQLIFKPETIMSYWWGPSIAGAWGTRNTNQGLVECIPVLMLSFETLHIKFSNIHLENSLEVILLLLQYKNLRFSSYCSSLKISLDLEFMNTLTSEPHAVFTLPSVNLVLCKIHSQVPYFWVSSKNLPL